MARMFLGGLTGNLEYYVDPGARHSFFNDQLRVYHPAAAADSWQRVLAFFAEHVRHNSAGPG